jgi:transcriptional regulator with XRE-family HTH domain
MESPIFSPMPLTLDQVARDRIKHWIVSTGVTQTELAARIGRTQAWMSRYLSGEFDADLETLQKIARAFGHSIGALLDEPAADPVEARVLHLYRSLPSHARAICLNLLEAWANPRGRKRARPRE